MTELTVGQEISAKNGTTYRVVQYLGEGLTARVYKAEQVIDGKPVALKVLRDDLSEKIKESFREEANTIAGLRNAESNVNDGLSLIPQIYERTYDDDLPVKFLAMELVEGQSVLDLLEKRQTLPEEMALIIADQTARVLHLLHTRLHKSYTDFQLKNIWWQEANQTIKVMDWNHVSEPEPDAEQPSGADADIVRLAAYLYQMLTGKGAMQAGETVQALATRAGAAWDSVSVGTRSILQQALHPNVEQRFKSAYEFREAVQDQRKLWSQDLEDLEDDARDIIRDLRSEDRSRDPELVYKADTLVDMLNRRRPDAVSEKWQQEIAELTDQVSPAWGSGMQYYRAGLYSKALELWPDEAAAWRRPDLWRWVALASQAAADPAGYAAHRDEFEDVRVRLDEGQWDEVVRILESKPRGPVDDLGREAHIQRTIQMAENAASERNWQLAAEKYDQAASMLKRMENSGYRDTLVDAYGWSDLAKRAERSREEDRRLVKEQEKVRQLQVPGLTFDQLNERITINLSSDPANVTLLAFIAQKAVDRGLTPSQRDQLVTTAFRYGSPPENIRAQLEAARTDAKLELAEQEEALRKAEAQRQRTELRQQQEKKLEAAWRRKDWAAMAAVAELMEPDTLPANVLRDLQANFDKAIKDLRPQDAEPYRQVLDAAGVPDPQAREESIQEAKNQAGGTKLYEHVKNIEGLLLAAELARTGSPADLVVARANLRAAERELVDLGKEARNKPGVLDPEQIDLLASSLRDEKDKIDALSTGQGEPPLQPDEDERSYGWRSRLGALIRQFWPFPLAILGIALLAFGFLGGRWFPGWPGEPAIVEVTRVVELVISPEPTSEAVAAVEPTQEPPAPTPVPPTPTPEPPTATPEPTAHPTIAALSVAGPVAVESTTPVDGDSTAPLPPVASPVYYDLPDLSLAVPDGWLFDWSGDSLQLSEGNEMPRTVRLVGTDVNGMRQVRDIPAIVVVADMSQPETDPGTVVTDTVEPETDPTDPGVVVTDTVEPQTESLTSGRAIRLEWVRAPEIQPWPTGEYSIVLSSADPAGSADGQDVVIPVSDNEPIVISEPPSVWIASSATPEADGIPRNTYRWLPVLLPNQLVNEARNPSELLEVRALGKLCVSGASSGPGPTTFLHILIPLDEATNNTTQPGRQRYWLAETVVLESQTADWPSILDLLPEVNPPPDTPDVLPCPVSAPAG